MTCIVYKNYNIFVKYVLTNSIVKNMKDSLNQSLKHDNKMLNK